ncbi:MAG: hypothetical protein AAGD25_06560 [Cyanobacteria bacterium P01_F01_bin.150]
MTPHPKRNVQDGSTITPESILLNAELWADDPRCTTNEIDSHFEWALKLHKRNAIDMAYELEQMGCDPVQVKPRTETFKGYVRNIKADPMTTLSDRLALLRRICEAAAEMDRIWKSEREKRR